MHLMAGRRRKDVEGRKIDERAGQKRRVHCTRRIDGEEAWALNTRLHGRGHRDFIVEIVDERGE